MKRRELLKMGAAASTVGLLKMIPGTVAANTGQESKAVAPPQATVGAPGYVIRVHRPGMLQRLFPDAQAAEEMVNLAVMTLCGTNDLEKAWRQFVRRDDRVGIKINALGGRFASTMKEVVDPIVKGVLLAGVPEKNIMIYDQYGGNMRQARYAWQEKPDRLRVINHAVLGYEKELTRSPGGGRGNLAKTLKWTTAVINVPVLKDHDLAGVTCAIKNMVCGSVESPPLMHRQMHTALPHFYALNEIAGRVRLILCDGSFCQYEGGPKYNPSTRVAHDCVYATTDPVAMDTVALTVINELRKKNGYRSLEDVKRPASFLKVAEEIGLGVTNMARINLKNIELPPLASELKNA
jgi:uncharacterized protein (DUF362 family)